MILRGALRSISFLLYDIGNFIPYIIKTSALQRYYPDISAIFIAIENAAIIVRLKRVGRVSDEKEEV